MGSVPASMGSSGFFWVVLGLSGSCLVVLPEALIKKYSGAAGTAPQLTKLGSGSWNKAKQKVVFSSERRDLEDGEHLKWISLEELHDAIYLTNRMIISGKSYPMVPSAVASIYLVKQFFDI